MNSERYLRVECTGCSGTIDVIVEPDGYLRMPGDALLEGGKGLIKCDAGPKDEDDCPVNQEWVVDTVTKWKERLEELLKKGVIPRQALRELVKEMDEALGDGMELEETASERGLSIEVVDGF